MQSLPQIIPVSSSDASKLTQFLTNQSNIFLKSDGANCSFHIPPQKQFASLHLCILIITMNYSSEIHLDSVKYYEFK